MYRLVRVLTCFCILVCRVTEIFYSYMMFFLFQLLSDTTEGLSMDSCILFCAGLKLCFTLQKELSQYLDSSVLSQRSTEWAEFFLPSIRACLLPMFLSGKPCCVTCQ